MQSFIHTMKKGIVTTLVLLACLQVNVVLGQEITIINSDSLVELPQPDTIIVNYEEELNVYVDHLDSFIINLYFKRILEHSGSAESVRMDLSEAAIDSMYRSGLNELNKLSPFDLAYNQYTKAFINLYVYKKRELTENCMGISEYYFPIFEEILDKHNLPIEFKYLAVVESALNIKARSRAGASGLWQFMYRTGKEYGLEINSYVDERYELYAATEAACEYFEDLYRIYENWELVIAAYNCGPGNVNKAIRRSGGKKTYWEIRNWLPRETRGYVPAFIAVNYAMNFGKDHGLAPRYPDSLSLITDTINLTGPLNLRLLSAYFCSDFNHLSYLNPCYKLGVIPDDQKAHTLRLPLSLSNAYISERKYFLGYSAPEEKTEEFEAQPVLIAKESGVKNIHIVKDGEVLGVIAEKYGVGVSKVKDWNNLYSSRIYEGQELVIYTDRKIEKQPDAVPPLAIKITENPSYKYHTIKSGDTLWDIAKQYEGVTVNEIKALNKGLNYKKLKPGDKIIVSLNT